MALPIGINHGCSPDYRGLRQQYHFHHNRHHNPDHDQTCHDDPNNDLTNHDHITHN
jgi:hypothetical protein